MANCAIERDDILSQTTCVRIVSKSIAIRVREDKKNVYLRHSNKTYMSTIYTSSLRLLKDKPNMLYGSLSGTNFFISLLLSGLPTIRRPSDQVDGQRVDHQVGLAQP